MGATLVDPNSTAEAVEILNETFDRLAGLTERHAGEVTVIVGSEVDRVDLAPEHRRFQMNRPDRDIDRRAWRHRASQFETAALDTEIDDADVDVIGEPRERWVEEVSRNRA